MFVDSKLLEDICDNAYILARKISSEPQEVKAHEVKALEQKKNNN